MTAAIPHNVDRSLEADVASAARQLQAGLSEALIAKGLRLDEPLAIARGLDLDRTMGWKLSRFANCLDPVEAATHLPGKEGLRLVVAATEKAGVPKDLQTRLRDATTRWWLVTEKHAGDRATLQLLLAGVTGRCDPKHFENQRKGLYQGASAFWGVQAEAILRLDFYGPNQDPDLLDLVTVRCLVGFRRLRPVPWVLSKVYVLEKGLKAPPNRLHPLDPALDATEAPLLKDFCSQPVPAIQRIQVEAGYAQDMLVGESCGETSKVDCVLGEVVHNCRRRSTGDPRDREFASWQRIRTPARYLNLDVLVHRSIPHLDQMYAKMCSELQGEYAGKLELTPQHPAWIPIYESVLECGQGPVFPPVPEYGQYRALVSYVFEQNSWDASEFRLFRLRMRFPPISTVVGVAWPMAPALEA